MEKSRMTYARYALALLIIDWILGAGRFAWAPLIVPFVVVNFPTGFLFLWLERQSTPWWQSHFGIDDEIGQFLAFFVMIFAQAGLIRWLYLKLGHLRKRSGPKNLETLAAGTR